MLPYAMQSRGGQKWQKPESTLRAEKDGAASPALLVAVLVLPRERRLWSTGEPSGNLIICAAGDPRRCGLAKFRIEIERRAELACSVFVVFLLVECKAEVVVAPR